MGDWVFVEVAVTELPVKLTIVKSASLCRIVPSPSTPTSAVPFGQLWAAQWLDEHREYAVTGIRLDRSSDVSDDDASATTTLVVTLDLANEPAPAQLGPWFHGVPPVLREL